jgi:hypothetical protein
MIPTMATSKSLTAGPVMGTGMLGQRDINMLEVLLAHVLMGVHFPLRIASLLVILIRVIRRVSLMIVENVT